MIRGTCRPILIAASAIVALSGTQAAVAVDPDAPWESSAVSASNITLKPGECERFTITALETIPPRNDVGGTVTGIDYRDLTYEVEAYTDNQYNYNLDYQKWTGYGGTVLEKRQFTFESNLRCFSRNRDERGKHWVSSESQFAYYVDVDGDGQYTDLVTAAEGGAEQSVFWINMDAPPMHDGVIKVKEARIDRVVAKLVDKKTGEPVRAAEAYLAKWRPAGGSYQSVGGDRLTGKRGLVTLRPKSKGRFMVCSMPTDLVRNACSSPFTLD